MGLMSSCLETSPKAPLIRGALMGRPRWLRGGRGDLPSGLRWILAFFAAYGERFAIGKLMYIE